MKRVTGWFIFLLGVAALSRIVMKPKNGGSPVSDVVAAMFQVLGNLFKNTLGS